MKRIYRADLHVHSRYSDRPTQRVLRQIGCPESFAEPRAVYDAARRRGMDFVTLTDHDTLAGSLAIADLPDTFVSVEFTTWFPEDGYKLHLVALDISEAEFADAMTLRGNVYELADYLRAAGLVHFPAHPLFTMTSTLTVDVIERMLLLFDVFEIRNGSRAEVYNRLITRIVDSLTAAQMTRLAEKHGVEPRGTRPWRKSVVGGSDDHSGLFTAGAYTEVEVDPILSTSATPVHATRGPDDPLGAFLAGIRLGASRPVGGHGDPLLLAHSIYTVSWLFMKRELEPGRRGPLHAVSKYFGQQFGPIGDGRNLVEKARWWTRHRLPELYHRDDAGESRSPHAHDRKETEPAAEAASGNGQDGKRSHSLSEGELIEELLDREGLPLTGEARDLMTPDEINRRIFAITSHLADAVIALQLRTKVQPALQNRRPLSHDGLGLLRGLGTIGFAHFLSIPYYGAYSNQTRDRDLLRDIAREFLGYASERRHVALFSEDLPEEGIAPHLQDLRAIAEQDGATATLLCCTRRETRANGATHEPDDLAALDEGDAAMVFPALDTTVTSLFPGRTVVLPPLLHILEYLNDSEVTALHADAPGPMGLAALACARLLHLPVSASWPAGIVGPSRATRRYLAWFYRHVDEVIAPTAAARDWLVALGVPADKVRPTPSWLRTVAPQPDLAAYHSDSTLRLDQPS